MPFPRTFHKDPRQALLRVLHLEIQRNYADKSVAGGLDRLLKRQGKQLAATIEQPSVRARLLKIGLVEPFYAKMSVSQRRSWVKEVMSLVDGEFSSPNVIAVGKAPKQSPISAQKRTRSDNTLEPSLSMDSPISSLKAAKGQMLQKLQRLGVNTIKEMVYHFPRRYNELRRIADLRPQEEQAALVTLWEAQPVTLGTRLRATQAVVGDHTGNIRVIWFNQPYLANRLKPNSRLLLNGKVDIYRGHLVFESPQHEIVAGQGATTSPGQFIPIYPSTEGLTQRTLRKATQEALEVALSEVSDHLPQDIRDRQKLPTLPYSLTQIHGANNRESLESARRRLAFDELFLLQLRVLGHRQEWQIPGTGLSIPTDKRFLATFFASIPFELTEAQQRVLLEILKDMTQAVPMNRLLHGEVGSGKTAVAVAALLTAAANGYQGALMAPTEILAEQHFLTIVSMLERISKPWKQGQVVAFYLDQHPKPVSIGLLVGGMSRRDKENIYQHLEKGTIDIVVGTHTLIQENVKIPHLGLAVVDEQHRFGVLQRSSLGRRSIGPRPHMLVMSATPIPRTLALTLYGDLDISIIDQLPPGRQKVRTRWARPNQRNIAYDFVRDQIEQGHQAFVICPLIEESDVLGVRAATEECERLAREIYPDLRLGLLHGRMPAREKTRVMEAFREGELDILVSTPVVEVGVDIPNATVMLIEAADRFGMAQMHQFRGRVGRGKHPGYCLLLADNPSEEAAERLSIVERINDGFLLAEEDLRFRGPGEYMGTRQSGLPDLKMARLSDTDLLSCARKEASDLLDQDPHLELPEHSLLRESLAQQSTKPIGDLS